MPSQDSKIDFTTFVLSLASSTMIQLGRVPDPTGEATRPELGMARQSIDMLAMLKDKTRGNLTPEETQVIERVLHDVRLAFVEESRKNAS